MSGASTMPEQLGSFKIVRRLGGTGFIEVYLGEDTNPRYRGDRVSVRRVRPDLLERDPLFRLALLAEGELGRRVSHPNVVQVYDVIEQTGVPFLICEYVDGLTLHDLMEAVNGPIDPGIVAEVARQLCEGLAAIHAATDANGSPMGVVHQDVQPASICINARGDVKLLDTGVGRSKLVGQGGVQLKNTGAAWQSPEQLRGDSYLTPAADQYSLGAIVFEMLSGIPFPSALEALATLAEKRAESFSHLPDTEDSVIVKLDDLMLDDIADQTVAFEALPPVGREARQDWARKQLPTHLHDLDRLPGAGLDEILGRMLAYDPRDRYPTTRQAGEELLRWAWGMAGQGMDVRQLVESVLTQRGTGEVTGSRPVSSLPIDDDVIRAAADSSFLPPISAVTEPSPPESSSPVEDQAAPLGALMGTEELDALVQQAAEQDSTFAVKTNPGLSIKKTTPVKAPTDGASRKRGGLLVAGVATLAVLLGAGAMLMKPAATPEVTDSSLVSPSPTAGEGTPAVQAAGAPVVAPPADSLFAAPPQQLEGFRGLRGADGAPEEGSRKPSGPSSQPGSRDVVTGGNGYQMLPEEKLVPFEGKRMAGTGSLTIGTSPPGVTVILDGLDQQDSPVTFDDIPAGEHQIILRSEELGARVEKRLMVKPGEHWRGTYSFREKRWKDGDD